MQMPFLVGLPHHKAACPLRQSLRNFAALTKGETFRILYNKKKYDIGVVEVRGELGHFMPGAAEAVCIIEVQPYRAVCCATEKWGQCSGGVLMAAAVKCFAACNGCAGGGA